MAAAGAAWLLLVYGFSLILASGAGRVWTTLVLIAAAVVGLFGAIGANTEMRAELPEARRRGISPVVAFLLNAFVLGLATALISALVW
jgi:hypothetical protein